MKRENTSADKPEGGKGIGGVFYLSLVVVAIADLFIQKHTEFTWENLPVFFAACGVLSCIVLVFAAKLLRFITKRNERYYD